MKKMLAFVLVMMNLLPYAVMAQSDDVFEAEADIYEVFVPRSEVTLMSVDENKLEAFEEKLTGAWDVMAPSVRIYPDVKITKNELNEYFSTVIYENPQYYYVNRAYSYRMSGDYVTELLKMTYTEESMEDVEKTWAEIKKATDEILLGITSDMTDVEKVMAVHDYLALNYVYDITDMDQTYMIFLKKSGVCAAYSEAFMHMMNILGINCTLVSSQSMQHIWNMVEIDGNWYHIDVTWDDPVNDRFALVMHEHVLLSEEGIKNCEHYGFTSPYSAEDTSFDNAPWRGSNASVVSLDGVMYYVEGNNLKDETGKIIFKKLDCGDGGWKFGNYSLIGVFAGLCKIGDKLYFNSEDAIYSYNPKTEKTEMVLKKTGICGLYADKNVLIYNKYDMESRLFVKSGEMKICDIIISEPFEENGKVHVRLFNDSDTSLWVITDGENKIEKLKKGDLGVYEYDKADGAVYVWTENMTPLTEKFEIK